MTRMMEHRQLGQRPFSSSLEREHPTHPDVSQVDAWGGYAHKERLDAEAASAQLPELAGEIERCRREHAARPDTRAQALGPCAGFDDVAF